MKFRSFGNLPYKPSALGLGCMRLPTAENNARSANITQGLVNDMVAYAVDSGVNYFDTAYFYHLEASEPALGTALKGKRDKVIVADKLPMMALTKAEQFDMFLDNQLKRLQTDYIDNYLFHGMNKKHWKTTQDLELIPLFEKAKKQGKIKYVGFSFHDSFATFEQVINGYDKWDFCQIQYNFMDTNYQAGTAGLKLAASKNIGVAVMEPLRGGKFANPMPEVLDILKQNNISAPLKELALKWLWNQPEVGVVLSGMSDMEMLKENIAFANGDYALSQNEITALEQVKKFYESRRTIPCTACQYCMPCPQGINIPAQLHLYNEVVAFDYPVESRRAYSATGRQASKCVACGVCEERCPQAIHISEMMPMVNEFLS